MEAIASSPIQLRSIPVIYGQGEAISEYLRQEFPHREFIWDAENSILLGKTTLAEWQKIEELVSRRDVPGIAIRGILTSQDRVLVLAEYSGSIRSLEIGDNIEGWTLVSVQGRDVEFARGEQRFTVSMGR